MSGAERRKYLTATVFDQDLLDWCADNEDNRIEAVMEIELPDGSGTIYASDRHKYIVTAGFGIFYRAMIVFPEIIRTLGEWLVPELQFSTLQVEHSNADSRFNIYLVGGAHYAPFVNRKVTVKIGLAELGSSYKALYQGVVTEAAGASRSLKSFKLLARDLNERYNVSFPKSQITPSVFPFVEDANSGKVLPVIYGDWTVDLEPDPNLLPVGGISAEVPAYVVNGADPNVVGGTRTNVHAVIADHNLKTLQTGFVFLLRGQATYLVDAGDVVNVTAGNRGFEVVQDSGAWVAGAAYEFQPGDLFLVRVVGMDLATYTENPVQQAKDILTVYGAVPPFSFHANWDTFRDKSSPPQSSIVTIRSRIWIQDPEGAISFARSLLEQVRLEAFFDRDNLLKINSLHFEDWVIPDLAEINIQNRDIEENTFEPAIDEKNNFNRAQGFFKRSPLKSSQTRQTRVQKNSAAITQVSKAISRHIDYPNLIVESDVKNQVVEILRLASSTIETPSFTMTWRGILRDLGEFGKLNIKIGSVQMTDVPFMFREIRYNPQGFKLPVRGWAMALCPFPGYTPGYAGTVGGYNATIDEE